MDFHFLRPYWLFALFFVFLLAIRTVRHADIQSAWADVCDKNLLRYLAVKGTKSRRKLLMYCAYLICSLIVIALAGPTWIKKENPALSVDNPVMIVVNLASNMWLKDVSPSRIVRTKFLIKDLTSTMENTETGLIVYSAEPFMITPLTEDVSLVDNLLPALEANIMPKNGDRLDRAIDFAVERMKQAHFSKGNLVVFTADVGERLDMALDSAMKAEESGFDVNIVNVGANDNEKLQMIADKGKGVYLSYKDGIAELSSKINDITDKQVKKSKNMQVVWEDLGYYLFWLPAIMILYYFRRGLLAFVVLCVICSSAEASWFLNDNQEALQNFEAKKYDRAVQQFKDTRWKGAAAYRMGDYETALKNFSFEKDATALYNQGNALAKSGKLSEAIKKYEEALKLDADFADAKFNLEYLKKQQKNQQKQQQNKNQQKNQQDKKQNQEQNQQNKNEDKQQNQPQNQQSQQDKQQSEQQKNQQEQMQNSSGEEKGNDEDKAQIQQQEPKQKQNDGNNAESQKMTEKQPEQQQNQPDKANKSNNKNQNAEDMQQQNQQSKFEEGNHDVPARAKFNKQKQSPEQKEKMRARAQKYREIPEDKGGLLRALIKKEFDKNRYAD